MADPEVVYPPSEDTYLLLDASLEESSQDDEVLEVGTGSGYVAQKLESEVKRVVATDINPHAVESARDRGIDVVRTNLFDGIGHKFDLVVFNPPYLPTDDEERQDDWMENALDGGETGREVIEEFVKGVGRVLDDNGRVLLLVSSLTGIDEVKEMCSEFSVQEVAEGKHFFEKLVVLRLDGSQN